MDSKSLSDFMIVWRDKSLYERYVAGLALIVLFVMTLVLRRPMVYSIVLPLSVLS